MAAPIAHINSLVAAMIASTPNEIHVVNRVATSLWAPANSRRGCLREAPVVGTCLEMNRWNPCGLP